MFISPLLSFLVLYIPLSQPNPTFGDARVKKHWDPSKSPSVNLSNLGLSALPNDMNNARTSSTPVTKTTATVVELFDIPESDKPSLRQRYPLEQEEEEYIAKCMEKHGDDYTAMRRDIRTNNMQHTEEQLRKWGSRYLLLTPSQRRLPVPETVQPLLPAKQQTQPTVMASQTSTASDDDDDEWAKQYPWNIEKIQEQRNSMQPPSSFEPGKQVRLLDMDPFDRNLLNTLAMLKFNTSNGTTQ